MKSDLVDILVEKRHETAKAVLVKSETCDVPVWIPLSLCEIEPAETGKLHVLTLPERIAIEKGLV